MAVMASLGGFRFSLGTAAFQELEKSAAYRWETQSRIGRHPAVQFIGEGHREESLRGTIYPDFRGGANQMDRLRAIASAGKPVPLIYGHGRVLGLYVIDRIDEAQSIFKKDGSPRKIEFTVTVRSYGEDGGGF